MNNLSTTLMENHMKILLGITIATLSFMAPALHAEPYIGLSLGNAQTDVGSAIPGVDVYNLIVYGPGTDCASLGTCTSSTEDSSAGLKLFGGNQLTPNFAVEAYYANLGSYSASANDNQGTALKADVDVTAFGVSAVGLLPVSDKAKLFAKAGVFQWNSEVKVTIVDTFVGFAGSTTVSDDGIDFMVGIGGQYDLTEKVILRAEYERYATDTAIGLLSVGVMYKF